MAVIAISDDESWVLARWAFTQLLDRAQVLVGSSPELVSRLEQSKALDGLLIYLLTESQRRPIVRAVTIAAGDLAAELAAGPQDELGSSFLALLVELQAHLNKSVGS